MPVYSIIIHTNTFRGVSATGCAILITPTQEATDLLYHYLQTHPKVDNYTGLTKLERPSKQGDSIYARVNRINHPDFVVDDHRFSGLAGNIYIYSCNGVDGLGIPFIPQDPSPAPLHGGTYLIRQKGPPGEGGYSYWSYLESGKRISISNNPTVFRIELADSTVEPKTLGTPILIASDMVYITAITPSGGRDISYSTVDDKHWRRGELKASEFRNASSVFRFGALHRGFAHIGDYVKVL
ncbi:hypothetical protein BJY00DRAFT_318505 [Aspergillus carlsbadensis]|nr:hypothetical protein BJY00DRAFT_318505 [Aspergillus carlsbadensis]